MGELGGPVANMRASDIFGSGGLFGDEEVGETVTEGKGGAGGSVSAKRQSYGGLFDDAPPSSLSSNDPLALHTKRSRLFDEDDAASADDDIFGGQAAASRQQKR